MSPAHRLLQARAALGVAALLVAMSASAVCPPVTLQPRFALPSGSGPVEVVAADLNGDGVLDLVTGESGSSMLGLYPGIAPGGTFGARVDIAVGSSPFGLAVADLDADGINDIVVACWGANVVQVLRGLGGGTFAAPVSFPAGAKPYEIALGDFNGDGVTDVAVADNDERSMRILIGGKDGSGHWDGTFAPSAAYPTSNYPLGITTGDFNEDGITDVVVTEYTDNTVALFLGNGSGGVGDGTFQPAVHIPSGVIPYDLATGDFNHDGHIDLAVDNSGDGGVHVLLGSGTGSFPTMNAYLAGSNCSGVAPADLDGDGITDLVVSTSVAATLYLLKGSGTGGVGNGGFEPPTTLSDGNFPVHVIVADLDGNGRPDAVTCCYLSNELSLFRDGCAPDPNVPHITRIRDVPNDQGGKVFITWTRSALDVTGGSVNAYQVWRQVPSGSLTAGAPAGRAATGAVLDPASLKRRLRTRADGATEIVYWEALATLPAKRLAGYGYTAATPQDSLPGSNPFFTYYISALTSNIDVFYDSDPDSGYSVDNLSPDAPEGLTANAEPNGTHLHWLANTAPDLWHYELHRSATAPFTPSAATLVTTTTTCDVVDPQATGSPTYMLAAVDLHGNYSPWTTLAANQVTAVGGGRPGTTWLAAPSPNPARGVLEIGLALARAGPVSLALMDAQGRCVRMLIQGERPAGELSLHWDGRDDQGRDVGAGLYWLKLSAGRERLVRRFALVR